MACYAIAECWTGRWRHDQRRCRSRPGHRRRWRTWLRHCLV